MPNLAAKYRPKTWDEVVEQKLVIKMVKGLIEDTHMDVRNFLFTGPAGCAKTTICRILANVLNEGKGEPIEIDAASNSGVDSMRVIIDQARSYPVGTKWKIFIIDEVHSFSNAAWQAALKTFEEVPAKTIFLMATTNPEKIPETILSRVQQFRLSKISVAGIENRLKYIVEQENKEGQSITYTDDAISYIAKMANGGMRDAITLLEKAIASDRNITSESLMSSLGLPNYDQFFELLQFYASKDNAGLSLIHI